MDNQEILKFEHLIAAASTFKEPKDSFKMLQSYFYSQCCEMSSAIKLPKNVFSPNIRCRHCFTSWHNNLFSSKSHTSTKKLTSSSIKRYKKIIQNKDGKKTIQDINNASMMINSKIYVIKCTTCGKSTDVFCKRKHQQDINTKNLKNINAKSNQNKLNRSVNQKNIKIKQSPISIQNTPNKNANINKLNNKKLFKKNNDDTLIYQSAEKLMENKLLQPAVSPSISNKKKKNKDKFAGLCKNACITSKKVVKNDNPLNLLLKQVK